MVASWTDDDVSQGLELAESAYGASVLKILASTIEMFDDDYRTQCLTELEVRDKRVLEAGLAKLTGMRAR